MLATIAYGRLRIPVKDIRVEMLEDVDSVFLTPGPRVVSFEVVGHLPSNIAREMFGEAVPKPLTLTDAQLRAWRRGRSIFRIAKAKPLTGLAASIGRPSPAELFGQFAWEGHEEPIKLTAEQIREWRRAEA